MIYVYYARPVADVKAALESIRKSCPASMAVVVRKSFGCSKLLYFSLFLSLKSFQMGMQAAKTPELEWLCRLACTNNVSSGLRDTGPRPGEPVAIASTVAFPAGLQRELGITGEASCSGCDRDFLAKYYGLSEQSLSKYRICDLAKEKMAIGAVR